MYSFLVASFLSILFCNSGRVKTPLLPLVSVTEQHWSGGPAGYYGVNYCFRFNDSSMRKCTLSFVWIKNKKYMFENAHGRPNIDEKNYCVSDSHRGEGIYPLKQEKLKSETPPAYKGAALIGYYYKKRIFYQVVPSIENLPALNFP